ncbi:MAG: PP2C family protein-serine/threonine phosphatase [Candidatus Helarchaeota archaeon]
MTNNTPLIDSKYLLGVKSILGDTRRQYEDRVKHEKIVTGGNLSLIVGIVADGVGSADNGGLAAQMSIDTVMEYMRQSDERNIPKLIIDSIKTANRAVYRDVIDRGVDASTTITVAVIVEGRVYIGNVGDSRAYWIQQSGKMLQLTRDHSYFNIYGGDQDSENAEMLVNAIGLKEDVYVDIGFYLDEDDQKEAIALGKMGLPLKLGEAILLCSDGLIKSNLMDERYVTDEEIIDAVQSELQPNAAAVKLCSYAEGRNVDDNVSVLTINYTDETRIENSLIKKQKEEQRGKIRIAGLIFIIALLGVGLVFGISRIIRSQSEIEELRNQPTVYAEITVMIPTPTPTEFIPVAAGDMRVDYLVQNEGGSYQELVGVVNSASYPIATDLETNQSSAMNIDFTYAANLKIQTNDIGVMLSVGTRLQSGENNRVFLYQDSEAVVNYTDGLKIDLFSGDLFIQLARGEYEAEIHLPNNQNSVAFVKGSKMIVDISGDDVYLWCIEGECRLEFDDGSSQTTDEMMNRRYRPGLEENDDAFAIEDIVTSLWNYKCLGCIAPLPEPTATPTSRIVFPTDTEEEESEPKRTEEPTKIPARKPTRKPTDPPPEPTDPPDPTETPTDPTETPPDPPDPPDPTETPTDPPETPTDPPDPTETPTDPPDPTEDPKPKPTKKP